MPSSEVMHKYGKGTLHSGSKHGPQVESREQAIAIKMSEERSEKKHGGKYLEGGMKHHGEGRKAHGS